jgi:branched-chain amino acid transport system permease protein
MIAGSRAAVDLAVVAKRQPGWLKRHRPWLIAAALLAVLPHVPGLDSSFGRSLLSQMGIAAVFAMSYNLLLGQTGLLSFGHAVYFGLGAYAAIHLMRAIDAGLPVPMPLVPLAGAAGGLAFGMLFGSVTTRRAGVVFALISLGVGELVFAAMRMLQGFSGGEEGITANRGAGPHLAGFDLTSQLAVYYVIAFWVIVAAMLMHAFLRTPVGRLCNAVRDNPERAEFIGYDAQRVRFVVFSVSAAAAGLAGGLHAINYEIVAAESVSAARSGAVLLMVYIGGVNHFIGAALGAITITWLQVSLSDYTAAWQLYLGLFFMAIVLFAPGGLAGLILLHAPIVRTRAFWSLLRGYVIASIPTLVMALGAIALLEINYRLSTQPEAGGHMKLFRIDMDVGTPWPWVAAIMCVVAGFVGLRRSLPPVRAAWERARVEAKAQTRP